MAPTHKGLYDEAHRRADEYLFDTVDSYKWSRAAASTTVLAREAPHPTSRSTFTPCC